MTQPEFKYRLVKSTNKLLDFTRSMVTNKLSGEVKYLIEANRREGSPHLDQSEIEQLKRLNELEGKLLSADEVASILVVDGLAPLWINSEVTRSRRNETIVLLKYSRRLREGAEMNAVVDEYPPFHPLVPLPPWRKEGKLFNINWKHQVLKRKWYARFMNWKVKGKRNN